MANFPALPLWTDAYLADTRHLSTLQHGAYLLLLMEAWRRPTCSLPDDDGLLSRLCGLDTKAWAENRAVIMSFWKLDGRSKTFVQRRLSKERTYVTKKSRVQRDKAAKRWKDRKKTDAAAGAAALPVQCPDDAPTPTPTPTPIRKKTPSGGVAASRGARLAPDWSLPREWRDWTVAELGWDQRAIDREAAKFGDFWHAKAGKDAAKVDWLATWRGWCRRADEPRGGTRRDTDSFIPGSSMISPC